MDGSEQVAAYVRAGLEDGAMAPVYLFHCANICEIIRPGDTVLDLACGPAKQLAMVARLNPATKFVGVDLSEPMLGQARELVARQGLENVSFRRGDISNLSAYSNASFDAVVSTMALHHLPDGPALERTFLEVARLLKPGGGTYLVDFGRLKSERSILYFAERSIQERQDYLNSLRAAFTLQDFRRAAAPILAQARLYSTFIIPYMVAIKSSSRQSANLALGSKLAEVRSRLSTQHQIDVGDLMTFFRLGGMTCALLG